MGLGIASTWSVERVFLWLRLVLRLLLLAEWVESCRFKAAFKLDEGCRSPIVILLVATEVGDAWPSLTKAAPPDSLLVSSEGAMICMLFSRFENYGNHLKVAKHCQWLQLLACRIGPSNLQCGVSGYCSSQRRMTRAATRLPFSY